MRYPKTTLGIVIVVCLAAWAYQQQTALLLQWVTFQNAQRHHVAPARPIDWDRGPDTAPEPDLPRRPNIILIVADDLGYNDLSTFGGGVAGGRVQTPHIDRLAAEGVIFSQSYSGAATCAPSRAMLMTGRYPTRTGFAFTPMVNGMGRMIARISNAMDTGLPPARFDAQVAATKPLYEHQGLPAEEVTLAEVLRSGGYHTAHIGKWHLGRDFGMAPHEQGFDESLLMASGLYLPEDHPNVVNARLPFDPIDQFLWASMTYANSFNSGDADRFEPGGYLTDYWTDEAIRVIDANQNRPFFLYLAHWGVHSPLQATRDDYEAVGDIEPHRLRVYAAMVRALDRSVGRMIAALDERGLSDDTLVIFTSDNGGAGYLGLPDLNAPYRGWKVTQFEGGIRVPLFMRWPGVIPSGSQVDRPVAHIDVFPTLAGAATSAPPASLEIDGRDLLPLATDPSKAMWEPRPLFWEAGDYRVVRFGDWKLQVTSEPLQRWLFNLAEDPTEQNNVIDSRPEKTQELLGLLQSHYADARVPLYEAEVVFAIPLDKHQAEPFFADDEFVYVAN